MKYERIGNIATFINGAAFRPEDWSSEGMKIIRIQNLTDSSKPYNFTQREVAEKYIVRKGDVLVSWSATIDVFIWNEEDALLNQHIFKVIFDNSKINKNYFIFAIKHTINDLSKYAHGSTMKHIVKGDFENHNILLPPLSDQIRISNILSKAEALIKQRKESIDLLDEFLKSTFFDMFGDPVRNEKGWKKVALNKFGKIITGNTPPRDEIENYSNSYIEWIKTDNILSDSLFVTKANEYLSEKGLQKSRFVDKGALLVACIAGSIESVGRASLTDRTVSFNQQINAIQPNNEINSFFLYSLFNNTKKYIQNHATKGMKKILTKGNFEQILMIKPPITLQTKFASVVEKTEVLKSHYQESLNELENLFGSLCQRAFKGELDLDKMEIDSTVLNEFKIVEKRIIPELNSAMLKVIEQSQKMQKLYDQQAENAEQTTRFLKPIQQMEKLLAPIKNLPVIPDAVIQAQNNYERILASLPKNIQKKEETKIGWEDVSTQYAADLIKEKYTGFHFTTEMLFRFFNEEHLIYPNYFSSEELKTNPQLHSADDLKSIVFSALNNGNPFLKLEQVFYNGEKENFTLNITPEDYELIKERSKEERSGVYFTIVS